MPSSASSREREFRESPAPQSEAAILDRAFSALRDRLPEAWEMRLERPAGSADDGVDGVVRIGPSDGPQAVVLVEAKRLISTRDAGYAVEQLKRAASRWGADAEISLLVAARYLAPSTRERLTELGAGYADATGNVLLRLDRPALYLRDRGADRDPWRGPGRPRGTLQGPPAARVVRGLIDFLPPYTIPELAERTGASSGATYRVIEFVEQEGLLERQRYGPILDVRWRPLLERWSEDYGFAASNSVQTYLEPRGLRALTDRLAEQNPASYAVTGSMAAERIAPYAPARLAMIYARDAERLAADLQLRLVDGPGVNVAIAAGAEYEAAFARTTINDGLVLAGAAQIAVDLLSGPGRNPGEAMALLEWMAADERAWRS